MQQIGSRRQRERSGLALNKFPPLMGAVGGGLLIRSVDLRARQGTVRQEFCVSGSA